MSSEISYLDRFFKSITGFSVIEYISIIKEYPDLFYKKSILHEYKNIPKFEHIFRMIQEMLERTKIEKREIYHYFFVYLRDDFVTAFGWAFLTLRNVIDLCYVINGKKMLSIGSGKAFIEFLLQSEVNSYCSDTEIICTDIAEINEPFMEVHQMNSIKAVEKFPAHILFSSWPPYISHQIESKISCKECIFCQKILTFDKFKIKHRNSLQQYLSKKRRNISSKQFSFELKKVYRKWIKNNASNEYNQKLKKFGCVYCANPYSIIDCAYNALSIFKGNTFILIGEGSYGCTGSLKLFHYLDDNWKRVKYFDHPNWDGIYSGISIYERNKVLL